MISDRAFPAVRYVAAPAALPTQVHPRRGVIVEPRHATDMPCAPQGAETNHAQRHNERTRTDVRGGFSERQLGEPQPGESQRGDSEHRQSGVQRGTSADAEGRSGGIGGAAGGRDSSLSGAIARTQPEGGFGESPAQRGRGAALTGTTDDRSGAIVRRLIGSIGAERFARWFGVADAIRHEGAGLVVSVRDKAAGGLLEKRFGREIREALSAELGDGASYEVRVVAEAASAAEVKGRATSTHAKTDSAGSGGTDGGARAGFGSARAAAKAAASERYRLESFLVSASNRLAYNAAVQMAEGTSPVRSSGGAGGAGGSPLFIHGACGVGKTHLLQGIAVRFRERHPGATVRVTSGEQFMNDFVNVVRAGSSGGVNGVERFRRMYRKVDLLCIDDVHFLASKQATQGELLHTFDEIERGGARMVLVSDEHPRRLAKFSPALVSRFMAGMVAGLGPPDAELRAQIVRAFGARRGLVCSDAAVDAIVERTGGIGQTPGCSVREIEGLMVKIEAVYRLTTEDRAMRNAPEHGAELRVTPALVARALDGDGGAMGGMAMPSLRLVGGLDEAGAPAINGQGGGATPTHASESGAARQHSGARSVSGVGALAGSGSRLVRADMIVSQTCAALNVDTADLSGKTRHKRVVLARAIITHLARQMTTHSYPEIARIIGRPNHSTVITAHQRLAKQLENDEPLGECAVGELKSIAALVRQLGQVIQAGGRRG